jgi:hypothetical protein
MVKFVAFNITQVQIAQLKTRIDRELELNLRIKPRRRIKRDKPEALSVPSEINQTWSMDFMADSLTDGRSRFPSSASNLI